MIQRIQSIFLLIVGLTMFGMLFMKTWQIQLADKTMTIITPLYSLDKSEGAEAVITYFPYSFVGIIVFLSSLVAIVAIFQYKNRLSQIKLGALNALLISASLVISMFLVYNAQKPFAPENYGSYGIGIYFPVIGLIFNLLSNRFIRRDEKLVQSVDRLR